MSSPTAGLEVRFELAGWELASALLEVRQVDAAALAARRREVAAEVRGRWQLASLAEVSAVAALRRLFRAAGCDPTRYRPSSEALLRRLLKGDELPAIHPLVDLNNCLSAQLAVPCCVMREGSFTPPLVLRAGVEGESYESLRGPFRLAGKPLLADRHGPCDAPITGSERVEVRPETRRAWLVSYLPAGVIAHHAVESALHRLAEGSGIAVVG